MKEEVLEVIFSSKTKWKSCQFESDVIQYQIFNRDEVEYSYGALTFRLNHGIVIYDTKAVKGMALYALTKEEIHEILSSEEDSHDNTDSR